MLNKSSDLVKIMIDGRGSRQLARDIVMTAKAQLERERLKIYHVRLPDGMFLGYDSYSEFVVFAYSEEEARKWHPDGHSNHLLPLLDGWILPDQIQHLVVTLIGYADTSVTNPGVICASFHAG